MDADIKLLLELQSYDAAILELEENAASFDPKIQEIKDSIKETQENLAASKNSQKQLLMQKKNLENDASSKETLIAKHQSELGSLKSNDAYKAMLSEIEKAKQELSQIETQELELLEKIDQEAGNFKDAEQKIKNEENELKKKISDLEAQKMGILEKIKERQDERSEFAENVPSNLLTPYNNIRQKSDGSAVVKLLGTACAGCRMNMPPGKIEEVKNAKGLLSCDSCSRLLYWPEEEASEKKESQPG